MSYPMNLFLQATPTGLTDVLVLPLILFVLGLGLWYGGLHYESRTEQKWLKWTAFIPLGIGLLIGIQKVIVVSDYVYRQTLPNQKTMYGHYLAIVLPLTACVIIAAWHFYLKRRGEYDRMF